MTAAEMSLTAEILAMCVDLFSPHRLADEACPVSLVSDQLVRYISATVERHPYVIIYRLY